MIKKHIAKTKMTEEQKRDYINAMYAFKLFQKEVKNTSSKKQHKNKQKS